MAITVNIKSKAGNFKGAPLQWNVVVNGPREIFTPSLARYLHLQGVGEWNKGDPDHAIWTTKPAGIAPPFYLADALATRYGVKMTRETQKMVSQARDAVPAAEGLDKFVSRTKPASAGSQALRVRAGSSMFIANCDESNPERRAYLEGAGWLPMAQTSQAVRERFGTMPFTTGDPFIAGNLEHRMDEGAVKILNRRLGEAMRYVRDSRSHTAPEDFATASPEGLDYLEFQKVGIQTYLRHGKSGFLADDMGLGKTIQGIGILNGRPAVRNVLVSCQANMRLKWVREIEKWKINEDLTVGHAEGDVFPDTDIVVINYDIVDRHKEKLRARKWDLVLGDEGQNMKNPEAKRTLAMLGDVTGVDPAIKAVPLAKGGQLLIMSGTPKPNRISDLWPLLTATRPDIWGSGPEAHRAFLNRYQPPFLIRKKMRRGNREYEITVPLPGEPLREMELQLRMRGSGSFVRRMKRDTDLPPKFRTPIELPFKLSKADRDALAEIDADIEALAERLIVSRGGARVGRSELASSVIDTISGLAPGSPDFTEGARVRANLGRLKAPYMAKFIVDELVDDAESFDGELRKTVIFAHHKDVIQVMAAKIREKFPDGVVIYDGSISSAKKKQAQVDRFQEDPDARVFLMSLSGASGITLTASYRMRIAEPDWNPANMAQIEDRIWRIGQMRNCDIGYLFVPDSHDINMGMTLIRKMETDEKAINTFSFPESVRNAGKALLAQGSREPELAQTSMGF